MDKIVALFEGAIAGGLCPKCHRGTLVQGELGLYCPLCGWWPGWRRD